MLKPTKQSDRYSATLLTSSKCFLFSLFLLFNVLRADLFDFNSNSILKHIYISALVALKPNLRQQKIHKEEKCEKPKWNVWKCKK